MHLFAAVLSPPPCLPDSHDAVGNLGNGETQFTSQFGLTLAGRPKAVVSLRAVLPISLDNKDQQS